jgi:hypothetical protein
MIIASNRYTIMATKSQQARTEAMLEQAAHKPRPAPKRRRSKGPSARKPHNLSARAGKRSAVRYEPTAAARPSRKSTRRAEHRQRPANPLERTAQSRVHSPENRASRARARAVKARGHG